MTERYSFGLTSFEGIFGQFAPIKAEGALMPYTEGEVSAPPDPTRSDLIGKGTTVGQLIQLLGQFPPDQRVMVRGYESGYDNPEPLQVISVKPDPYDSSVYGDYEDAKPDEANAFSAVLIDRP